ncbi:MAG: hypothetical protein ACO1SV_25375 [Fimbriimonas sp.]
MSFSVQLSPDLVPLEPGSTTPVSVVVTNKGPEADRYELELEGLDSEWKAVPVPVFGTDAGEAHTEKVFLKPPRASESLAGNYPFVVRVRSLVTGETRTVQGVAQVKTFHHLSMEINPRKGFVSPTRKHNAFAVTLVNLGNTEHTVQLVGTDPEDACTYEFDAEQVVLGPGQQREVEVIATPTTSRVVSGSRLIGFTITGRSIDTPSVVASSQAQLEQRPLLTPTSIVVFLMLAGICALWWVYRPKPPTLTLGADPRQIVAGESVTVTWAAENARRIVVTVGDRVAYEGPEMAGTRTFTLSDVGTTTIHVEAQGQERTADATAQIEVQAAPTVPAPVIDKLSVDRDRIRLGEPFILRYRLSGGIASAVLQPSGLELDPALDEREIVPTRSGKLEYTLVVRNSAGQMTEKSFTVNVVDESDARILAFNPSTKLVPAEDARVTLNWQVAGAERVEIKLPGEAPMAVSTVGSQEFNLTKKTMFTITAWDGKGRQVTRSTTVDVQAPIPPKPDMTSGGDTAGGDTATGGGTTATTGDPGSTATTGDPTTGGTATTGTATGGRR